MATHYHESGQLPEGIVLAHTLHGRPDESVTNAHVAAHAGIAVQPAPYDGIPYYEDDAPAVRAVVEPLPEPEPEPDDEPDWDDDDEPEPVSEPETVERSPDRAKHCTAKNDTCMGWAMGGSTLCAAHAGVWQAGRRKQPTPVRPPHVAPEDW